MQQSSRHALERAADALLAANPTAEERADEARRATEQADEAALKALGLPPPQRPTFASVCARGLQVVSDASLPTWGNRGMHEMETAIDLAAVPNKRQKRVALRQTALSDHQRDTFEREAVALEKYLHLPMDVEERRRTLARLLYLETRLGRAAIVARVAALVGQTARSVQRADEPGRALWVDLLKVAANVETTAERVFEVFDTLSAEQQLAIAAEAQRRADYRRIVRSMTANARLKKLNEAVLEELDDLQKNSREVRRQFLHMDDSEHAERLADMQADRRKADAQQNQIARAKLARFNEVHTGGDTELARLFYALPQSDRRAFVQNTISAFLDDETLQ